MRILVFSSLYPNAVNPQFGLFVHRRAESVSRRGAELRVVAPVPYFPGWLPLPRWRRYGRVPPRERLAGIAITHPRYPHTPGPGMYLQAASLFAATLAHLRRLRYEFPFDLIDAHYIYPDGVAATLLAQRLNVPVVLTARGSDINLLPQYALVRKQVRWALARANAIVGVSGALTARMHELGAPPEKLHTVPNGIDRLLFHFGDPMRAREALQLDLTQTLLLSVGNLNELKGHMLMIEALAQLRQRGITATLHVFGEGPERGKLEARAAALGLRGQVTLHGSVAHERLGRWYQAADLFLLASSREGWPNVLNEALACGLPVVATAVGGVPEIVQDGVNGVLVQERSAAGIVAAVESALTRSWQRQELAAAAARRGWSEVAEQLVQLFANVSGRVAIPSAVEASPHAQTVGS